MNCEPPFGFEDFPLSPIAVLDGEFLLALPGGDAGILLSLVCGSNFSVADTVTGSSETRLADNVRCTAVAKKAVSIRLPEVRLLRFRSASWNSSYRGREIVRMWKRWNVRWISLIVMRFGSKPWPLRFATSLSQRMGQRKQEYWCMHILQLQRSCVHTF